MRLLDSYLKENYSNIHKLHLSSGIPETTLRTLNKKPFSMWSIKLLRSLSTHLGKELSIVISDLDERDVLGSKNLNMLHGKFSLSNRRYIGSKTKLVPWIVECVTANTIGTSFFDVFAGTGIVTESFLEKYEKVYLNDFLTSNYIIYKAFFDNESYDAMKIKFLKGEFQKLVPEKLEGNYFSENFGNKFFSMNDSKIIGEIRSRIEANQNINSKEKSILIASLLYSADKVANTVGHYDAYRKNTTLHDRFSFDLIQPHNLNGKSVFIFNKDANVLVDDVEADIAFIDPPYNSRQYSRFYHVLENLAKWMKPSLEGVALKPPRENMSAYSRTEAPEVFNDLIKRLRCKYIVVTYSNNYSSKSNSSKNKITHTQIFESLNSVGKTKIFEKEHNFFNAGKSSLYNLKEFLFITKVGK